jgi:filamentous hemagglutinin family protein
MMKTRCKNVTPSFLLTRAGRLSPVLTVSVVLGLGAMVRAQELPQGGNVIAGSAGISQNGSFMGITAGNGAIINWQSFNIGQGNTVQFFQPGATSRVLNRVTGSDPSKIAGSLIANGIVYISNPAGVYFAHGSLVNVGGIYAAAGSITNADFINNVNKFSNTGRVENSGTINVAGGGAAHLIGRQAANYGTINAPNGVVTMTAGSEVYIGEQGGQVFARVSGGGNGDATAGVTQAGQVNAKGGRAVFGAGDMYSMAIDHPGSTTAKNITLDGGSSGVVSVSGTLDASDKSAGGVGGTVDVLGHQVGLFGGTIDASGDAGGGTVRIGGDWQGQGDTRRADAAYVSSDSTIKADAITNGNGGKVVVYSDRFTNYQGRITARGGSQGGNGGQVETSGKADLYMSGSVNASAQRGQAGQWLLDPTDVTLSNNVTSGGTFGSGVFNPGNNASANVNLTEITNALSGGTSVTINTASAGGGNGDITLIDPFSVNMTGGGATLILNAVRDILISNTLTATGAVGNELGLTFTAGRNVSIDSAVTLNGGLFSINAPATVFVNAAIATNGGAFNIVNAASTRVGANIDAGTGDISLGGPVVLTTNVAISGNDLTFGGTVDSDSLATPRDLALNTTGNGITTFNGNVGNIADLGTFTTNADGTTVFGAQFVKGTAVTFNDAVIANVNSVVRGLTSVTFNSTVDSQAGESNDLVVNAPVTVFNGSVGNAAVDTFMGIIQTNTAGTTRINAPFVKGEVITFQDAVTLGVDTVVRGTTQVTFESTVDSDANETNNLVVNSALTTFNGDVGNAAVDTFLGIIQTNATGSTRINAGFVKGEVITFQDAVTLGVDVVVRGSTQVTFESTVDSDAGESNNLIVNSPLTRFNGDVGNAAVDTFLGIIQTNTAGTTTLNGAFVKGQVITFQDTIILGRDVVVRGSTQVTFESTVDSEALEANDLIVNSPLTVFNGDVGNATVDTALGLLQTNTDGVTTLNAAFVKGARLNFEDSIILGVDVVTKGTTSVTYGGTIDSQSGEANNLIVNSPLTAFNGNIGRGAGGVLGLLQTNQPGTTTINASAISAERLNFEDAILLGSDSVLDATTSIVLGGAVDSQNGEFNDLSLSAPLITFGGAVGLTVGGELGALETNASGVVTINGPQVSANQIDFRGHVVIGNDTAVRGIQRVTFHATLNSENGEANDLQVNSPDGRFIGQVGTNSGGALGRLGTNPNGTTTIQTGQIVADIIDFQDDVVLTSNTTITANTSILFAKTVMSEALETNDLIINSPLTTFAGIVGNRGANRELGTLRTNITGTTTISGSSISATIIDFQDAIVLGGNTLVEGVSSVTFANTVDSPGGTAFRLSVDSPLTTFAGRVGSGGPATELSSLTTGTSGVTVINTDLVRAREMNFLNTLVIGVDTTLTAVEQANFQIVNSDPGEANDLTVNSPAATFGAAVGAGASGALGQLASGQLSVLVFDSTVQAASVDLNGTVNINGGSILTTGDQTYTGSVFLQADTTLEGNDITFNGPLNSSLSDRALTINTTGGGVTSFNGPVGTTSPLRSISTNADGRTVLGGGQVIAGGNLVFNDVVTLGSTMQLSATNVTFGLSVNSDGTARGLSIDTVNEGITIFDGAIGDVNPLLRLTMSSDGTTRINGGSVTTTLAQAYNNDVVLGGPTGAGTTLIGGSVSFGGKLNSNFEARALTVNTTGNGETTFSGEVGDSTPLLSITTNADGTTRFFGPSIRTTGDQTYADGVILGADVLVTGNDITFNSTIDSTLLLGAKTLTVNSVSTGTTTFNGAIGSTSAIESLTTNADGTTRIGANIRTDGGSMTFNDKVLIFRDSVLNDTNGSGVTFGSTIDSEGTPQDLTVFMDVNSNASVGSPSIARIRFGGNVGSTLALQSLRLGGNRTSVPTVATMFAGLNSANAPIAGFGITFTTIGAFTMGALQKMTVFGNVAINAGGPVAVGDISALGNISITAPSIAVRTRPGGVVLGAIGNALVGDTDNGVDFVAGGTINFSVSPSLLGGFAGPDFATPDSTGISSTLSTFAQRAFGQPVTAASMLSGTTVLDLRAVGPSNTNIASVIAGALPTTEQSGELVDDTGVGRSEREELNQIGISTRTLDEKEFLAHLLGRRMVSDVGADPTATDYTITINRLPSSVVRRVLESYRSVFWKETYDPQSGLVERTPQTERVGQVLSKAWAEYSAGAGAKADPMGFRAYLEAVPGQAEALNYLNGLRELFSQLGYLGLSPTENQIARNTILRSVPVQGMTPVQLEEAITSRQLGGVS